MCNPVLDFLKYRPSDMQIGHVSKSRRQDFSENRIFIEALIRRLWRKDKSHGEQKLQNEFKSKGKV